METLKLFLGIQILLSSVAVIGIVYLVFRRVKKSKEERFEKRDN